MSKSDHNTLATQPTGTEASRGVVHPLPMPAYAYQQHEVRGALAATPTPPLSLDSMGPTGELKTIAGALAKADGWEDPDALWTDNVGVISRGGKGDPVWTQYAETAAMVLAALTPSAPIAAPVRDDGARDGLGKSETCKLGMAAEHIRDDFEAWIKGFGFPKRRSHRGSYENSHTVMAWNAWQASRKNVLASLPAGDVPGEAQTRETVCPKCEGKSYEYLNLKHLSFCDECGNTGIVSVRSGEAQTQEGGR